MMSGMADKTTPTLRGRRLAGELKNGLHALSIHALTPAQWEAGGHDLGSPACRGGAGK